MRTECPLQAKRLSPERFLLRTCTHPAFILRLTLPLLFTICARASRQMLELLVVGAYCARGCSATGKISALSSHPATHSAPAFLHYTRRSKMQGHSQQKEGTATHLPSSFVPHDPSFPPLKANSSAISAFALKNAPPPPQPFPSPARQTTPRSANMLLSLPL